MDVGDVKGQAYELVRARIGEACDECSQQKLVETCIEIVFAHVNSMEDVARGKMEAAMLGGDNSYSVMLSNDTGDRALWVVEGRSAVRSAIEIMLKAGREVAQEHKDEHADRIKNWRKGGNMDESNTNAKEGNGEWR